MVLTFIYISININIYTLRKRNDTVKAIRNINSASEIASFMTENYKETDQNNPYSRCWNLQTSHLLIDRHL